ncbi:unnamed protein product [Hydatigera taeniaeformis]|uniref:Ig-like domain-containing protein n=1 Tax=Hydatigena taeniaeformis TaxID=6205 RepID=A0A0R3WQ07_HYDTA|nr:unnamed protein product [Hydatigera taeniaeformis]
MRFVLRSTEHCVHFLFFALLFDVIACQLQQNLKRVYVYKHLMEKMPRDFACENVDKLAEVEGEMVHCVVRGIRQAVFVVVTQEFQWYPSREFAVDTGSAKNIRCIQTPTGAKLKLLQCRMNNGRASVTILQDYYAKFNATSSLTRDRVECSVEYEGNITYFSTPVSVIKVKKLFYEPLFDSAYLKGASKFPLELYALTDPEACKAGSKTLASSINPLLKGVPGRYNVTCRNGEFSQGVLVLNSTIFEIFYQEMTVPFAVRLSDSRLKMSDLERYACFAVTLNEMKKVGFNEQIDSSDKNTAIHCAAFVGPIAVEATLYHFLSFSTAIKIQLLNNRQYYLLGEHIDDIEVQASIGLIDIPSHNIHCKGKIPFQSPFLRVSSYQNEGTVEVSCFAEYKEQKGAEKHFRLHFLVQANFRLYTGKLSNMYIVRASYLRKPGPKWIDADPVQLASQVCNVYCISIHKDGPSFNSTIAMEEISRDFEAFDCYCNRTYKLTRIRRTVKFSFLLKRGLILLGRETLYEDICAIDSQSEIGLLPGDIYQKATPLVKYRLLQGGCPDLKCECITKGLEQFFMVYWNKQTGAVEIFGTALYERTLAYLECYDIQVKVINFGENETFQWKFLYLNLML